MAEVARAKQLLDALQTDLHALSTEARRKSDKLKQVRAPASPGHGGSFVA